MLRKMYHIVFYLNHLSHILQNVAHSLVISSARHYYGLCLELVLSVRGICSICMYMYLYVFIWTFHRASTNVPKTIKTRGCFSDT